MTLKNQHPWTGYWFSDAKALQPQTLHKGQAVLIPEVHRDLSPANDKLSFGLDVGVLVGNLRMGLFCCRRMRLSPIFERFVGDYIDFSGAWKYLSWIIPSFRSCQRREGVPKEIS